jgi:hypothetical protein
MTREIKKSVPVPPGSVSNKYPFGEMDIGDAFDVSAEELQNVRTAASWFAKRKGNGLAFTVRKYKGAYMCWRTA